MNAIELFNVQDELIGVNDPLCLVAPVEHYALLPSEPAFRRPAINLLSGLRPPKRGYCRRYANTSWPIGRGAFLRGPLTGGHLLGMLGRLYDFDTRAALDFLTRALSKPDQLGRNAQEWTVLERQEFEFATSLLPRFGIYVVDGSLPLAETRFGAVWRSLFRQRLASATLLMTANRKGDMAEFCRKAIVASHIGFEIHDDLAAALAAYDPSIYKGAPNEQIESADAEDF